MKIRRVAVLGGRGQMGALFVRRTVEIGLEARCLDTADQPLTQDVLRRGVRGADLVLLAVPLPAMDAVAHQVAAVLESPQILADVASVKVRPMASMLEAYPGEVVGTHPLFGPETHQGGRVALVPGRPTAEETGGAESEACAAVRGWFEAMDFEVFATTAEEHDNAMAMIQGLNFVTTVSYLATLARQEETLKFLTPSFQRRLDAAHKLLTQDAELFMALFDANPFSQDAVRRYRNFLHVAAGGDMDLLVQRAGWWWEGRE
jgi:chorismate mutase / prephenate dehydrogenase